MTPIRWTEAARLDLRAAHDFIARDSRAHARRTVDRLKRTVARLANFPDSGGAVAEWDRNDLREVLSGSFRVVDRRGDREVVILAVIRASRQPPEAPPRS